MLAGFQTVYSRGALGYLRTLGALLQEYDVRSTAFTTARLGITVGQSSVISVGILTPMGSSLNAVVLYVYRPFLTMPPCI